MITDIPPTTLKISSFIFNQIKKWHYHGWTQDNLLRMFSTYFKPAIRNLFRNKVITGINVLGLSIGISAALVIYLIIQYDYSFDRFEPGRDRIYRVVSQGPNWKNVSSPVPLRLALPKLTGIETAAGFIELNNEAAKIAIPQGNNKAQRIFKKQDKILFADSAYFSLFPRVWLAGSAASSLKNPYQSVLSETRAHLYFPGLSPDQIIGRSLVMNDSINTIVAGIVQDLKEKTDFNHDVFIALATIPASGLKTEYQWTDWDNYSVSQAVIRLLPGVSPARVEQQLVRIFQQQVPHAEKTTHTLQPLSDIHFNRDYDGKVSKTTLLNLSLLAVFILLLGSINFINLSTAQASERAKEIGMRKILGSSKGQLISRFLNETFLLTFISAILSLLIVPFLLKGFSDFLPAGLKGIGIWQPHVLLFLLLLIAVVGFLSGIYPALVLTGIRPLSVMKNQLLAGTGGTRRVWLRKTLTVSQFVIAQFLIIGVLVVKSQIHYGLQKDMGFRKEAIVNIYLPLDFNSVDNRKYVLQNRFHAIPEITAVSLGALPPAFGGGMTAEVNYNDGKKDLTLTPDMRVGDTAFIGLYHIPLLAGRNIFTADSASELLINETLSTQLGFQHPRDAVGKFLKFNGTLKPIVGVIADFNQASLRTFIHPVVFFGDPQFTFVLHAALDPASDNWKTALAKMKTAWIQVYPDVPFDYQFLDKAIENFYQEDQQLSDLLSWSAAVAIGISCLGLLGLVIFTANQRTKEIGVRKVLGATVVQIISLLSKDFIRLVALSFVIVVPIAWWAAHRWLQNFAYSTNLSWWIFAVSGIFMLVMALLILCLRAGRAALSNPVNSLRSE